jgi:hypothetical protein
MTNDHTAVHGLRVLSFIAISVLAGNLALAQAPKAAPAAAAPVISETAPVAQATSTPTQPIAINWNMHKVNGKVNVTVNPDGTWIFSGGFKDKKPLDDWDISFALKSTTGAIYIFHYEGNAADGIEFSKTGQSAILKDDFASFSHHKWSAVYTFHPNAAGRRAHYEAEEKNKEEIRKAEAEARKRHDEKVVAEKRAEQKAEANAEAQWEEQYAKQHPSSSGGSGGGGFLSTIGSVASTVGGVIGDIASIF